MFHSNSSISGSSYTGFASTSHRIAHTTASTHWHRLVALAALAAAIAMPVQNANASDPSQSALNACKINGQLVSPVLASGKSSAWIFVANFDQPLSKTTVMGCLASRNAGGVTYVPDNYCSVVNNTANRQFGAGTAQFDGNASIQCSITVVPDPAPPQFWVHARANLPTTINGDTFTLLASTPLSFTVDTDPVCLLKLNSRYNNMLFSHNTVNQCGSFVDLNSNLVQSTSPPRGSHRIGLTNSYGPTDVPGTFSLPMVYNFTIGAAGESYTLDYLVIDPPGSCCNPK